MAEHACAGHASVARRGNPRAHPRSTPQVRNLDASALRASFSILNGHFPERISSIFMYEASAGRKEGRRERRRTKGVCGRGGGHAHAAPTTPAPRRPPSSGGCGRWSAPSLIQSAGPRSSSCMGQLGARPCWRLWAQRRCPSPMAARQRRAWWTRLWQSSPPGCSSAGATRTGSSRRSQRAPTGAAAAREGAAAPAPWAPRARRSIIHFLLHPSCLQLVPPPPLYSTHSLVSPFSRAGLCLAEQR